MLNLDLFELIGLAIFGFFTGLGSTFGISLSQYIIKKMKEKKELLRKQPEQNNSVG